MERDSIGLVLTAGSQEKFKGGYRLEPDLEGKMRILAALHSMKGGQVSRILVAGGARNHGKPLAAIYTNWLKRYERMGKIGSNAFDHIEGGVNTDTDLDKAKQNLRDEGYSGRVKIFSSSYHFERKSIRRFINSFREVEVEVVPAEIEVQKRRQVYANVIKRILTENHLTAMRARNKKMDKIPQFLLNIGAYIMRR